ncbi:unnamed protein product [Rotaria magnacalcarata]|uniref:Uncharacterized protein n=1 Tax=Rotaria magnacalcarata TaxID=392030 RepID=A0A815LPX3_9BILA|nr:unnamed protein product [Rotaria magnacalcarata]CAF1406104.1 unnamed protein product [Rotaria magnacalcarata]CAF1978347.1 unnamed protein product [Rotaria magnacalcarata]CAF2027198.1 unnamed protein product [Rotaria magnacalcarata]CAF2154238.1 unnamed protein product [Rotaria magnacalcarata]
MYSIPFIGIILVIAVLSLSNTRNMFTYQLHTKRKKRYSISYDRNDVKNSCIKIQMHPFSHLDTNKYIRNGTTIPIQDDEELIKPEILIEFSDNDIIELRLEQDFDSDNDGDYGNDN